MRAKGNDNKVAVVVGTVTNDLRMYNPELPALKVCALRVTEPARARIVKAGGEILTFDQLALRSPRGQNTVLLQGACCSYLGHTIIPFMHLIVISFPHQKRNTQRLCKHLPRGLQVDATTQRRKIDASRN